MAAVVVFGYAGWVARYPEFRLVSAPAAQAYFDEATIYLRNDGCGPVRQDSVMSTLLNMLTAHIAWLNAPRNGLGQPDSDGTQPAPAVVGRISVATEGSVTVNADNDYPPGTAQWYQQSKYGAAYWAATAQYRTARYVPRPFNAGLPGAGGVFTPFWGGRRW